MATKTTTAPSLAAYATKPLTPTIQDYVVWLKAETGYDVDPQSVALASALRGKFQKSEGNQAALARRAAEATAKAQARIAKRAEWEAGAEERAAKKAARDAARIERAKAVLARAEAAAAKGKAA